MADRWYRKETLSGGKLAIRVEDPPRDDAPYALVFGDVAPFDPEEVGADREDLWALWALLGIVLGDEKPPAWAVGPIEATDVDGNPIEKPLWDPDCRDGKCGSCFGGPCEHGCHRKAANDA